MAEVPGGGSGFIQNVIKSNTLVIGKRLAQKAIQGSNGGRIFG